MSHGSIETHEERVARFLNFACWDHHTHGVSDHEMYAHAALRILQHNPEIALDSIYTAVVCGEIDHVKRILAERSEAARESGGSRAWEPLLYLCYTRFPHQKSIDNAVPIAHLLLDHGANPNAFYMAGDSSYSALVGVAGEGEQDSPRQPQAEALFELLLDRGADPFDIQVLYNTHFHGHILWWLKLVYAQTLKAGRQGAWDDPEWTMLDMAGYGPGAYFILSAALENNDLELAAWALKHGADPNIRRSGNPRFDPKHTLYERAKFQSLHEMAQLLVRYGAVQSDPVLDDEWAFVAASLRLDRQAVQAALEKHPEYLSSPHAISHAARLNRDDVIELLLDEGAAINAMGKTNDTALHHAAGNSALKAATLLIERAAEIDIRETRYDATPLGFAVHYDYRPLIEMLSRYSHDVFNLAFTGNVERLKEVLREQPDLALSVSRDGYSVLWWLGNNEERALEIVKLLIENGADPSLRSPNGTIAADWAMKLGMNDVAEALTPAGGGEKSK